MENLTNPHIKELMPRVAASSRSGPGIYLDCNELPYPPSPKVVQAIVEAIPRLNRYPDTLGGSLRKALANYAGVAEQKVIIGNGSDDLIELIIKVFIAPGEEVVILDPTFPIYALSTRVMDGHPVIFRRMTDFGIDFQYIIENITSTTKAIFIANPNNPTGSLVARQDLMHLIENVDCLVVIDECYYEFSQETIADLVDVYENLLILRSFSKSFGLAGLRLGYSIANKNIIDYLYRATQIYPINSLALVAGAAALGDWEYISSKVRQVCQERDLLREKMEQMGFIVSPSTANFLFVNTKPLGITSTNLSRILREQNIWVRDFGGKLGLDNYYFRTAIGTPAENQKLQAALNELLNNHA
ncbi:histidinol-phosphate transaminase [Leptothoe spongobia]|uniref:Histidinol-phosphate aminotransferase n=1 Tax=Leptothoe spongobia TAU-MAC 1115 TaxID=1967444 RepID=A0A947GHS0_9CYAN|nr:histidinol-phosphate transaminase [Leptothoe spongobia]MBT9314307.1 histidinol-phosphate transaminase [Leptothoe spongobia TAU-MAC 1115]